MLTVMIRYTSTGREVLIPATSVEFEPAKPANDLIGKGLLIVNGDSAQHLAPSENAEDSRDVFVMSDHGSTVARYVL